MPGRLRHRAPLRSLSAHVEATLPTARRRGIVSIRAGRDARTCDVRDAPLDRGAHAVQNGQPIAQDHAAPLSERKRAGGLPSVEIEGLGRLESTPRRAGVAPRGDRDRNREEKSRGRKPDRAEHEMPEGHNGDTWPTTQQVPPRALRRPARVRHASSTARLETGSVPGGVSGGRSKETSPRVSVSATETVAASIGLPRRRD